MSLSACSSGGGTGSTETGADANYSAATMAAACARVVTIQAQLSEIQKQVFQAMDSGTDSGQWGPIVHNLEQQKIPLNKEKTAQKLVCAGPAGQQTTEPSGGGTKASGNGTTTPVDHTKVAALQQNIGANPQDVVSLQALADTFFAAADYQSATIWEQKVLEVDSTNQVALMALGAAQFNLGNSAEAKKQWLAAAALYPDVAEVHYDLGF
ncbi:MAG: hypothetical protein HHJ13_16890 [Phycicoccus sp.]|nr:hypothetical protein [Phycicoccus sp.]